MFLLSALLLLAMPAGADEASQSSVKSPPPETETATTGLYSPLYGPLEPITEIVVESDIIRQVDDNPPIRTVVKTQSYAYLDQEDALRALDVSCTLSCPAGGCTASGCDPEGSSCTSAYCTGDHITSQCSGGTCTKTSTTGTHPAPENKN
jgi:hypothetical protein